MKRFKLKENVTNKDIENLDGIRTGGTWIQKDCKRFLNFHLGDSIYLNIGFPDDLTKWNDFDYGLVLDDDFCQPYTPFYTRFSDPGKPVFPFLGNIIKAYEEAMNGIPVLEELEAG